jgi:hypothetical protein
VTTETTGRETTDDGVVVTGVPATGRGVSVDVAVFVFTPADVPADTAGVVLTVRMPEGGLTADRDADGATAAEVAGRLTREGSPPAAGFPACFAALSRAI